MTKILPVPIPFMALYNLAQSSAGLKGEYGFNVGFALDRSSNYYAIACKRFKDTQIKYILPMECMS